MAPAGGWEEDWAAVWPDTGAGQLPADPPADGAGAELLARHKEIDQRVLPNLLRRNLRRAAGTKGDQTQR